MAGRSSRTTAIAVVAFVAVASTVWWFRPLEPVEHFGAWSLFPALVTISVCFASRNVLLALFLGILSGGLLIGNLNIIEAFLVPSLGSEKYAQILLVYLWALGGLLGLWNRTGGAQFFAESMARRYVRSRVSAKLFAWVMGIVFHQGGTISTVLAGTTVRPVADKHAVAHEELSYVVDSTASPIATIIPFNVWPFYVAGLIAIDPLASIVNDEADGVALFLSAIPFNFYAWFAVAMTFLFALDRLPLLGSPMQRAVQRVRETGALDAADATPMASAELTSIAADPNYAPSIWDFVVPMGVLLGFCIVPWLASGSPMVFEGFGLAVVAELVFVVLRGMPIADAFDGLISGIKGVTIGAVVLGLAVTLATVSEALGTSAYVIESTSAWFERVPFILPSLLLFICMIVAFAIGSSWGTYAVVFPVALPLALALSPEPLFLVLCFGAVLGGAVFGDQCSPISDTTILAALACGADLMDHVLTQLPLAMVAAGLAAVVYLVLGLAIV
jgi:Na+/H+ antiporter NhaC